MKQERQYPKVVLTKRGERRQETRHPWVYDNEIENTSDDVKDGEKKVQTITDKFCEQIDKVCAEKEKEIMTV